MGKTESKTTGEVLLFPSFLFYKDKILELHRPGQLPDSNAGIHPAGGTRLSQDAPVSLAEGLLQKQHRATTGLVMGTAV